MESLWPAGIVPLCLVGTAPEELGSDMLGNLPELLVLPVATMLFIFRKLMVVLMTLPRWGIDCRGIGCLDLVARRVDLVELLFLFLIGFLSATVKLKELLKLSMVVPCWLFLVVKGGIPLLCVVCT